MKILKLIGLLLLTLTMLGVVVAFEIKALPVGSSVAGIVLGFSLPAVYSSLQDISDTTDWKVSQRKLMRGGFLKKIPSYVFPLHTFTELKLEANTF